VARLGAAAAVGHSSPKPLYLRAPDAQPQDAARLSRAPLTVVGTGIDLTTQLTPAAQAAIAGADQVCYLVADSVQTLPVPPGATWIHPNADEAGYYRWSVPAATRRAIAEGGQRVMTVRERVGFVGNAAALLDAGALRGDEYLQLLLPFARDPDPQVVGAVVDALEKVKRAFVTPELEPTFAGYVRRLLGPALEGIGIDLRIETANLKGASAIYDPRGKVPLAIFPAWQKDFLNASSWIPLLFSSEGIGSGNTSLVGATPSELQKWGYDVTSVPSIDDEIDKCVALVGDLQVRCWAEADQTLMETVVPWVPYVFENKVVLVSDTVVAYTFDQFAVEPALDHIALSSDAA
jgi:hypothetical protein